MSSLGGYYTSRYLSENKDRLDREANPPPKPTGSSWNTMGYNNNYDYPGTPTPISPSYLGYDMPPSPSSYSYSSKLLPQRPKSAQNAPKTVKFSSQEEIQTYTREPSIVSSRTPSLQGYDTRESKINPRTGRVRNVNEDNRYGLPSGDTNFGLPKEIVLDVDNADELKAEMTPQELNLLLQGTHSGGNNAAFAVHQSEDDKARYSGYYINQKKRYDESEFIKPRQYAPKTLREVFIDETANSNKYNPIEVVFDTPDENENKSMMKRTTRNVLNMFRGNKYEDYDYYDLRNKKEDKKDSSAKIVFLDDPEDDLTDEEEISHDQPVVIQSPKSASGTPPSKSVVDSVYSNDIDTTPIAPEPVKVIANNASIFDNAIQKPSKTSKFRRAMRDRFQRAKHDLHQDHKEYMIRQAILEDQLDDEEKIAKMQEEEDRRLLTAAVEAELENSDSHSIASGRSLRSVSSAGSGTSITSARSGKSHKSHKSTKSGKSSKSSKSSRSLMSKSSLKKLKDGKKTVEEKVYRAGPNPEFSPAWNYLLSWITYDQPNLVEVKEMKDKGDKAKEKKGKHHDKKHEKEEELDKKELEKEVEKAIEHIKETKGEDAIPSSSTALVKKERRGSKLARALLKPQDVPYDDDRRRRYETVRKNLFAIGRYWNEPVNRFGIRKGAITPKVRRRRTQRVLIEYPDGTLLEYVIDIPEGMEMSEEYLTEYLQKIAATRTLYDPVDTVSPLPMGPTLPGTVPTEEMVLEDGTIAEAPMLSRSSSMLDSTVAPSLRSRRSSFSTYNGSSVMPSVRSVALDGSYYYNGTSGASWWPQFSGFSGPTMIFSNIDRLIKHFKLLRIIFSPIDVIAEAFPALQVLVIIIELIIMVWILYEITLLIDALCMVVKAVCSPVIAIGRIMNRVL